MAFLTLFIIILRFQPRVPGGAVRAAQAEVAARGGQGGHGGAPVPGHRAQVAPVGNLSFSIFILVLTFIVFLY